MGKYPVSPEKESALERLMESLGLIEANITEKFITGSGSGGQKINKTASCVYLKESSYQIEVKCQKTRSQSLNRYYARKELCEKVDLLLNKEKSKQQQKIEKIRRQKRKRSKKAKEKILANKKINSKTKELRKSVGPEED